MKGAIFSFAIISPLISPIKAVIVKVVKMGTRMGNWEIREKERTNRHRIANPRAIRHQIARSRR